MENLTILKRLGYILEVSDLLKQYEDIFKGVRLSKGFPTLDPLSPRSGCYNDKWRLLINVEIKPERWM
jgi:predicted transcriptional regulator of viral defense system